MGRNKVRYATKKQVEELTVEIRKLGEAMIEMAKWQMLMTVKNDPYVYSQPKRLFMLKSTEDEPLVHAALKEIFRKHPPTISQTIPNKKSGEP